MTTKTNILFETAVAIAACGLLANAAVAASAQINFKSTPGSNNYTSAGAPSVLDSDFVFELGAFAPGFTPSAGNTEDWVANWTPLGRAQYNPTTLWFTDVAFLEDNNAPFGAGGLAYIWGHDVGGEWILLSNPAWTWPTVTGGIGIPGGTTFSVSNSGTTTVVGSVAGSGYEMMTAVAVGGIPDVVAEQWYAQHFSTSELMDPLISGPLADPDGDGAPNIVELAAGTDPEDPASVRFAELATFETGDATYVRVTLQRVGRPLIAHILATSSDLALWDLSGATTTVVEDSSTMLILQSGAPVGSSAREFYQFVLNDPGS